MSVSILPGRKDVVCLLWAHSLSSWCVTTGRFQGDYVEVLYIEEPDVPCLAHLESLVGVAHCPGVVAELNWGISNLRGQAELDGYTQAVTERERSEVDDAEFDFASANPRLSNGEGWWN